MHAASRHGDPSLSINVNPVNFTFRDRNKMQESEREERERECINNVTTAYSHEECTPVCCKIKRKQKEKSKREREREGEKIKKKRRKNYHTRTSRIYVLRNSLSSLLSRYGCPLHGNCAHGIRGYITRHCLLFITPLKYGLVTRNPPIMIDDGTNFANQFGLVLFDKSSFVRGSVLSFPSSKSFYSEGLFLYISNKFFKCPTNDWR